MGDYLMPLLGGVLLGLSASLLMIFSGKIAGISGVIFGLFKSNAFDFYWRLLFLVSMIAGAYIASNWLQIKWIDDKPSELLLIAISGILVGMGTRMANGCNSGHGICGVGRLSKRSIIAVCVFMCCAILTASLGSILIGGL